MARDGIVHPLTSAWPSLQSPREWCSGCGLGIILQSLVRAGDQCGLDFPGNVEIIISGLGCLGLLGRTRGFPGRVVPPQRLTSTAFSLAERKPEKRFILLVSEADVLAGGWRAVLPARKDQLIIRGAGRVIGLYVNSGLLSLYLHSRRKIPLPSEVRGEGIQFNNLPAEARRRGAISASRWTPLHVRRLTLALKQVLKAEQGFHFLEVISPCLMVWADKEKLGEVLERMDWLKKSCEILPQASIDEMDLAQGSKITIGFLSED